MLKVIMRRIEEWILPLRLYLGRRIMCDHQRQIVQVSHTELIKGPCHQQELEAMEYARQHTSVRLPRIHRTYQRRQGLFIAMEFVQGARLDVLWPQLDDAGKREVVQKVLDSVRQLHSCGPPDALKDAVIASLSGGPLRDGVLGIENNTAKVFGPFSRLEDFEELHRGRSATDGFSRYPSHTGFVHADLAPRNMIYTTDGQVCILDWELAGWWPIYWERIKWHFTDFPFLPGWVDLMDELYGQMGADAALQ